MKVKNSVILITGCSSGFGLLTTVALAKRGAKVYATMRDLNKQDSLKKQLHEQGLEACIDFLDVHCEKSISKVMQRIKKNDGAMDILINNAGFAQVGFFEDLSEEEIYNQMETNFFGLQRVTRRALPLLRCRSKAKIINLSSISGLMAFPGIGAYNASKWALEGFSESLRYELSPFGIDVILIEPGAYNTKCLKDNMRFAKQMLHSKSLYHKHSQRLISYIESLSPFLKSRDPQEVVNVICKVIEAKSPAFRHPVGKWSKTRLILRKLLPWRLQEWIMIFFSGLISHLKPKLTF